MWNRFEQVRGALETQYRHVKPEDGLESSELERKIQAYYRENRERPLILVRAEMFGIIMREGRIAIVPEDWFADYVEGGGLLSRIRGMTGEEVRRTMPAEIMDRVREYTESGTFVAQLDLSHTTPDWESVLSFGPAGLRDRALQALGSARDEEQRNFYTAVADVFESVRCLIRRFAALSEKRGAVQMTASLRAIAERPPETLPEALQLALIYDTCQEIEGEPLRSQGIFDRLFFRFYRHDLEHGILTREQAKELLKFFWTKFYAQMHPNGKNFCFGGLAGPGIDGCNELTELCFEIHRELNRINPKLSFRVHRNTPERRLRQVAECIQTGRTAVVFSNDDVAFDMLRRRGKTERDCYNYTLIGCYEPAVQGLEMCCSMASWGNLVKPFEAVFNNGCTFDGVRIGPGCPLPSDYAGVEAEYLRQLDHVLTVTMENTKAFERTWARINPSPLLSGTMTACIESGRDVSDAGTRYNSSGVMCAGLGTVVDSLAAVKMLVDERKLCTVGELGRALKADWKGFEPLRLQALKRAPKWGNGLPETDAIGRRVMEFVTRKINNTPNARGGTFQTGLWSIDHNFTFGRQTAATPDGRCAGDPLSRNASGTAGMEKRGVTALMNSVSSLDLAECPDGAVLDVMLHPSAVSGPDGAEVIAGLIRGYFASGGLMVQFNILNAEELKRAQKEPEKYEDVQVRVCGWNSKFVNLSAEEQQAFILQAEVRQ